MKMATTSIGELASRVKDNIRSVEAMRPFTSQWSNTLPAGLSVETETVPNPFVAVVRPALRVAFCAESSGTSDWTSVFWHPVRQAKRSNGTNNNFFIMVVF